MTDNVSNISKEQQLIDRIVSNWGNAIAMPQMETWLKEYAKEKGLAFSEWNCKELWSVSDGRWFPYMDEDNPISGDQLWELWEQKLNT